MLMHDRGVDGLQMSVNSQLLTNQSNEQSNEFRDFLVDQISETIQDYRLEIKSL